ncbi:HNH endonuclease signature motif containing protein [Corynebacterium gerontici]|uniref:HNH nuclease domain-containing protein n=1 Tax=Corynebacterium gerontici TaxID=2079234 RepID=A0A3G6J2U8_9CORY|nr:HNH endonuclease signature motif containing protein [Corynebacterium gerontici]AZA11298.1 hypothetical protein CGERO_04910 [Corynebacterium gerontici]
MLIRHLSEFDPQCQALRNTIAERRKEAFHWWESLTPPPDSPGIGFQVQKLAIVLDRSVSYVRRRFQAVWILQRLPKLREQFFEHFHLDMGRLATIGSILADIASLEALDEALSKFLTPSRFRAIPSARIIGGFLRRKLAPFHWNPPPNAVRIRQVDELTSQLVVTSTHGGTRLMKDRLRELAHEWQCSEHDALWQALLGKDSKAVVNVYQHKGKLSLVDGSVIPQSMTTLIHQRARIRQLDIEQQGKGYAFPAKLRHIITMRDLHCRFPGCEVPAHACDIDHVLEFNRGGPTEVSNGQLLCRRHHNMKTERQVSCSMTPDGVVTWVIDGIRSVTLPEGEILALAPVPS